MERTGEKIGWIGGWAGGYIWILAFGILWFFQGKLLYVTIGTAIFIIACFLIVVFAPWRRPHTKYWKLMIPIYLLFLMSVIFVVNVLSGFHEPARMQYGLWIVPCLLPIVLLGNKTWDRV